MDSVFHREYVNTFIPYFFEQPSYKTVFFHFSTRKKRRISQSLPALTFFNVEKNNNIATKLCQIIQKINKIRKIKRIF